MASWTMSARRPQGQWKALAVCLHLLRGWASAQARAPPQVLQRSLHHWFSLELEQSEESPPPICSFMVAMCLCKKPRLNLRRTLGCESTPWSPSLILTNTEPVTHPSASHALVSTAAHAACTEVTLLSPTLKLSHEAPKQEDLLHPAC